MNLDQVLLGPCEDVLATLPDASVDHIITDPPYAMGNKIPSWADIEAYLAGGSLRSGGDFMGTDWEIPTLEAFRQMLRVLKPGGYCLAFSSTRTFDVMAAGAIAAGFMYHRISRWVHGQGFPKTTNISKSIDKMKGAKRKVIGVKPGHEEFANRATKGHLDFSTDGNSSLNGFDRPWMKDDDARANYHLLTEAATDDAKRWEGWGTALKPSWEPIIVLSKGVPNRTHAVPRFFYSAKTNIGEATLKGEIENDHPTKKPLGLMQALIRCVSQKGDVILDPYVGSGTTAEAAIREGRRFVVIEKDPKYHGITSKRVGIVDDTAGAEMRSRELVDWIFGDDSPV